jgi:HEAT repeat protein
VDSAAGPTSHSFAGPEPGDSARLEAAPAAIEAEPATVAPAIANFLNSVDPYKRAAAVAELARSGSPEAFTRITECFDDHSLHVRNAAARALRNLEPANTVDLFNRALENASAEKRRNIGAAIAASGLADEAIMNLGSDNREDTYNALSILFVMAKTGEVAPLVRALQVHGTNDIGKAVSKLLALSGHAQG